MSLTAEQVKSIATLARLAIDEDNIELYTRNLSDIIDFVAQLEATDTNDVEPMAHPLNMAQRLRADEVTESNERDTFQENAPQVEAGLYLVPRVLE
ncbi:MAG: Asp-tRNA(Asn)/Glu-tRNA(Gln) amidotransferase subunit GatC [Gammaproteobacteria bacterium]